MKEFEVEVTFDNPKEEILRVLSKFKYKGKKEICDTYYYDPLRQNLQPEDDLRLNETFRVRRVKDASFLTYKKQHFKGKLWTYSDEYETKVQDATTIEKIIEMLGLQVLIKVHNKREVLGLFIEVEYLAETSDDEMKIKNKIRSFIKSLNLRNVRELNIGKNQYLLSKKLGRHINIYNATKYD